MSRLILNCAANVQSASLPSFRRCRVQHSPVMSPFCSDAVMEAALPQLRRSHMAGGGHARGNSAKRKNDGRPGRSEHDKRQRLLFQTYDAVRLRVQSLQHRVAGDVPWAAVPSTRATAS